MMDSYKNCIEWLKNLDCSDMDYKERVINRMEYEHNKSILAPVRFRKGQYGKQYDSYSCGNCGGGVSIPNKYCPNCGRAIDWEHQRRIDNGAQ